MIYLTKKFIFILATLKVIYYKLVVIFEFISYFFRSPLTDEVEERHIFADVEWEGRIWVDIVTKIYKENNIPYAVYMKGEHVDGQGNLFF